MNRVLVYTSYESIQPSIQEAFDGFILHLSHNQEQAMDVLWGKKINLIVVNVEIDHCLSFVETLKLEEYFNGIPVLVLLREETMATNVLFQLGVDEVLQLSIGSEELRVRVQHLLSKVHKFEQVAYRDPLTGVYNRRYFDFKVPQEVEKTRRKNEPITLSFIDGDRFKSINDTYGHHIGDLVLQGIAATIQNHLRPGDFLSRYGGEEFVVLFPDTTVSQATSIMIEILESMHREPVAMHEGQAYFITFSGGVAEWDRKQTVKEWIQAADEAAYQAKREGRDRVIQAGTKHHANESHTNIKKGNVLIADADGRIREELSTYLRQYEIQIHEAENEKECFGLLQSTEVDCLISAVDLPGKNGFHFLEFIKTHPDPKIHKINVVLLTSRMQFDRTLIKGAQLGVDDVITKPVSVHELEKCVKLITK